jgi:hypothetical protein
MSIHSAKKPESKKVFLFEKELQYPTPALPTNLPKHIRFGYTRNLTHSLKISIYIYDKIIFIANIRSPKLYTRLYMVTYGAFVC